MMATTHLAFGAGCYTAFALASGEGVGPVALFFACTGSLLPDIDHPKSIVGRQLPKISKAISEVFGHRGITHSLMMLAIMLWVIYQFADTLPLWLWALLIGYISHWVGDWMTPGGIPLFWPIMTRFRAPFCMKVNGPTEKAIRYGLGALVVFVLLDQTWHGLDAYLPFQSPEIEKPAHQAPAMAFKPS